MAILMNKVANKSKRALRFEDLIIGDIFSNEYGAWFIRTRNIYDDHGDFKGNAIRLDNGQTSEFDDTETVKKLKKDLTVDYSNDDITEWYED